MTTRRYQYKGPWPAAIRLRTDPTLTLAVPGFVQTFDVTFDELQSPIAAVDDAMKQYGCFPEPVNTIPQAPSPYIAYVSPDGGIWQITVSNDGVVSVTKLV